MAIEALPNSNRIRWGIVGSCSSILIGLLCRIGWGESVAISCLTKWLTGIPCPMCGMTRSLTVLLQGDVGRSMSFHGLGIVLFVGLISTLLIVSAELLLNRSIAFSRHDRTLKKTIGFSVISLFLVHHGIRLVPMVRSGELAASISDSVIGRLLN
ncbi:MAG: DUF2752 domain-containing protein [Alkalinema sp. CAN_BIN05]|nr:DUF2752 domain-containing protein [Alkalinema sp. CAN_BIN05]